MLLLVGWIGLYQMGVPVWVPWAEQLEAKRKAAEAEVQRLNEEAQRLTKAATDAEAKLKLAEAEQQRTGTVTKAAEAELHRLDEVVQRQTKAAADAEAKLKVEQQRLAAVKAEEERKAPSLAGLFTMRTNTEAIGFPPVDGKPVSSIGECEQSCTQSATCKIFTFRKSTAMCYTYSDANFVPSDYFDTGIRKKILLKLRGASIVAVPLRYRSDLVLLYFDVRKLDYPAPFLGFINKQLCIVRRRGRKRG